MTALRFGASDVLRCRFAVSPMWETHAAVRVLYGHHRRPLYGPWIETHRAAAAAADLEVLLAVMPHVGYAPDFLCPPPKTGRTTFAAELERVRRTPLARVRHELTRCRDQSTNSRSADLEPLIADPRRALERLVTALGSAWAVLLEADWPRIRRILDDDVAHRGTCLTDDGLAGLFADLHPSLAWQDNELVAANARDRDRDLAGAGLLLVPSAFTWPQLSLVVDPPYQPSVVYPARGTARLWTDAPPPPDGLARLLGRTRATILAALDEPATTSGLAQQHDLGMATVSEHLTALHGAGLARKRRSGHQIRYWRTALGQQLVDVAVD